MITKKLGTPTNGTLWWAGPGWYAAALTRSGFEGDRFEEVFKIGEPEDPPDEVKHRAKVLWLDPPRLIRTVGEW